MKTMLWNERQAVARYRAGRYNRKHGRLRRLARAAALGVVIGGIAVGGAALLTLAFGPVGGSVLGVAWAFGWIAWGARRVG